MYLGYSAVHRCSLPLWRLQSGGTGIDQYNQTENDTLYCDRGLKEKIHKRSGML